MIYGENTNYYINFTYIRLIINQVSTDTLHKNTNNMAKKPAPRAEAINKEVPFKEGEKRHRMRVQFDINYGGSNGKIMDQDSDTIPDLNLTVRQLLENHTRGKGNEVEVRQPLYMEFPIPNLQDMTDVYEYQKVVKEQLNNISTFIKENDIDTETGQPRPKKESIHPPNEVENAPEIPLTE